MKKERFEKKEIKSDLQFNSEIFSFNVFISSMSWLISFTFASFFASMLLFFEKVYFTSTYHHKLDKRVFWFSM